MALQRTLLAGLVAVIVLAPLPFGSVETWARGCLAAACFGLGILWVLWRSRGGRPPLPLNDPALRAGLLVALVGIAQLIPLPRPLHQGLSPRGVEIRDRYEAPAEPLALNGGRRPAPFAGARPISLDPWATRQSVLLFLAFLLVALITIDLSAHAAARRALVAAVVCAGGFQAIYGLAEYVTSRQHIFGYAKRFYTDVPTGTFINRNHFAGCLAMAMPLAIALASGFAGRLRRPDPAAGGAGPAARSGRDLYVASAFLMLALTMATALAASRSRMGILSAGLSIAAVGLLLVWRSRQTVYAMASLLLAGGATMLLLQGRNAQALLDRFFALPEALRGEIGRWQMWTETAGLAAAFPWLGIGWGAYPAVVPAFRVAGLGSAYDHAHNDYLEILAEAGLLGGVLALAGILIVLRPLFRRQAARPDYGLLGYGAAAGVAAIGLHSLTDFNLAIPANALTFSVLLGLLIGWRRVPAPTLATQRPGGRGSIGRSGWVSLPALGAAALLALAPAVPYATRPPDRPLLLAGDEAVQSRGPDLGRLGGAVDGDNPLRLLRAGAALGKDAQADLQALVEAKPRGPFSNEVVRYIDQRLAGAENLVRRSVRLRPTEAPAHLALADLRIARCGIATLAGHPMEDCPGAALAELSAAVEVNPMSAKTHVRAARLYLAVWPLLNETEQAGARAVIEIALMYPHEDPELAKAALLRGLGT
jgi:O-antigen ligase